jgi:hypothetical protein
MELTLEQLLSGKQTRIKNREYFKTAAYVEPFLDRVGKLTSDFKIQAVLPNQITYTSDGEINLEDQTFNRVWIQAILPEECLENHNNVIGMVYGLDVRRPVFKVYKGALNMACTNLCVFSPELLECQEISPDTAIDFRSVDRIIEHVDYTSKMINSLKNTPFNTEDDFISKTLGEWVRRCIDYSYDVGFGKVKLACSAPIDAYKLLFKKEDSDYFIGDTDNANMYDVYGAMTQTITDGLKKDIMNQVEKSLLVKSILNI